MNNMEKYDKALTEGTISPRRLGKKRMKAFIEAVSEIAAPMLVEAVVTAHNALFEYGSFGGGVQFGRGGAQFGRGGQYGRGRQYGRPQYGSTPGGVRYKSETGPYSTKRTYNGNDLVRTNDRYQPPTSANTDFYLQNPQGSAAERHYNNVIVNEPRPTFDPRGERQTQIRMHNADPWDVQRKTEVQMPKAPPPTEPPKVEPPQVVQAPKAEPPKVECPPVCAAPEQNAAQPTKVEKPKEAKKPAPQYKWKDSDFQEIRGEQCSTTHPYVVNLVSYSSNNKKTAAYQAKHEYDDGVKGVYIYQYDGQAHNSSRKDVWRVRIGFFKSRAAARTYVIKHVKDRDQFKWWIARCDAQNASGDKMKPNTFQLAENIKDSDCIDESSSKKPQEQNPVNTPQNPTEDNKAPQGNAKETEHKNILDYASGK